MKHLIILLLLLTACKKNEPVPFTYDLTGTAWSMHEVDLPDGRSIYKIMSFQVTDVHVFYSMDQRTVHIEVAVLPYHRQADKYYTVDSGEIRHGQIYVDSLTLGNETFIRL